MNRTVSLTVIDVKKRSSANDSLPGAATKVSQDMYGGAPATGASASGDALLAQLAGEATNTGSTVVDECMPPSCAIVLVADLRTTDEVGSGREVFERLSGGPMAYGPPALRVDFYRAVWFDGLEAYTPAHYTVSGSERYIIPNGTLISGTQVSARYIVR